MPKNGHGNFVAGLDGFNSYADGHHISLFSVRIGLFEQNIQEILDQDQMTWSGYIIPLIDYFFE